jgi:hypothetical protein
MLWRSAVSIRAWKGGEEQARTAPSVRIMHANLQGERREWIPTRFKSSRFDGTFAPVDSWRGICVAGSIHEAILELRCFRNP